jgi:stress-induced morphogen
MRRAMPIIPRVQARRNRGATACAPNRFDVLFRHMNAVSIEEVRRRIEDAIPGAKVQVGTFSGHDHFEAVVEAAQFEGKSLVEQHRMVYAAVDGLLGGAMHALALKTRVPADD